MAASGRSVISLAVGQPSAAAPAAALDAARCLLAQGRVGYTDASGRASLRARIARLYAERHAVALDPGRVMVTTGSSAGFNLAFLAAFDPGDRVLVARPGYPAYRNILAALGVAPVEVETGVGDGYVLTADRLLAEHRRARLSGVLIASPANPTGTVTPRGELRRLMEVADREGITVISDEIYHGLVYGEPAASALEFSDRPIVVNSLSKYWCMTGWRIGWLVLPPSLGRAAERIGQSLYISAPELSQVAAEAAFDAEAHLEAVKASYEANRILMLQAMPAMGFEDLAPIDGAFYAYARVPHGSEPASALARRILAETGVAVTPGLDFDPPNGERFLRLSYAGDTATVREALDRLNGFFR